MITKNILESNMNSGIQEQNRLIDTLKKIVGGYTSSKRDPLEQVIERYLTFHFSPMKKLTSNEKVVFFVNEKGKSFLQYSPEKKILLMPGRDFLEIKDMFETDEDSLEDIIKMWMKKNYDVDIDYIDYYY